MEAALNERLPLTGERTAPGWEHETYWLRRHERVYAWIGLHQCRAATLVLDVGSGEGFGADSLVTVAGTVVAVELDAESCRHTGRTYPDVIPVRANVVHLPIKTNSVDLAVSLQVIEHVWDVSGYLSEMLRICVGPVIVSTPNRPVFSPGLPRGARPTNPFHVEEFDAAQLAELFARNGFTSIQLFGLHHGARIDAWERDHGSIVSALVEAALTDSWPTHLMEFQSALRTADFTIDERVDGAQDLIVVAS